MAKHKNHKPMMPKEHEKMMGKGKKKKKVKQGGEG